MRRLLCHIVTFLSYLVLSTIAQSETNDETLISTEIVDRGIFEDLQQMFKDPFGQGSLPKSPPNAVPKSPIQKVTNSNRNGQDCNNPYNFQDNNMIYLQAADGYPHDAADGRNIVLGTVGQISAGFELQFHLHMPLYPQDSTGLRTNLLHFGDNNVNRFPSVWLWNNYDLRVNLKHGVIGNNVVTLTDYLRPCGSYYIKIRVSATQLIVNVVDNLTGESTSDQRNHGFVFSDQVDVPAFASYAWHASANIEIFTQRPLNGYVDKIKMFKMSCDETHDATLADTVSVSPFLTVDHDYQCVAHDRPEDSNCVNPFQFRANQDNSMIWNQGDNIDLGVVERIAPEEGQGMSLDFFLHMPVDPIDSTGKVVSILHFGADNLWKYPSIWLKDNHILKIVHKILDNSEQTVLSMNNVFESCGSYHIMIDFTSTKMTVNIRTGDQLKSKSKTVDYALPAIRRVPVYKNYRAEDHGPDDGSFAEGPQTTESFNGKLNAVQFYKTGCADPWPEANYPGSSGDISPFAMASHGNVCPGEFIVYCDENPCLNGGTCTNNPDVPNKSEGCHMSNPSPLDCYTCTCIEDYTGKNCETAVPCEHPGNSAWGYCQNGGVCSNTGDYSGITCECVGLYTGDNCEIEYKPCDAQPCGNDLQGNMYECINTDDNADYSCVCTTVHTGKTCETVLPCWFVPCAEPGTSTCVDHQDPQTTADYDCNCHGGYTGEICDLDIPCSLNPCDPYGDCTDIYTEDSSDFVCACDEGRTGTYCQTVIPCHSNPCDNSAPCVNTHTPQEFSGYVCDCSNIPFTGDDCEIPLLCDTGPCDNGGTCVEDEGTSFTCTCENEFTGNICETPIQCMMDTEFGDPLDTNYNPCENGGTCSNAGDYKSYSCDCPTTHIGFHCDIEKPCTAVPCLNGGVCLDNLFDMTHTCTCLSGYTDSNCETPIPCLNFQDPITLSLRDPCLNGGDCINDEAFSEYTCECQIAHTGDHCETPIPCFVSPCLNGGTCSNDDDFSSFTCECLDSHFNTAELNNCGTETPCFAETPCQNGGICSNAVDFEGWSCDCGNTAFTGADCSVPLLCTADPAVPCVHGNCEESDDSSSYTCTCETGFTGVNCESVIPCSIPSTSLTNTCTACTAETAADDDCVIEFVPCNSPCQHDGFCTDINNEGVLSYNCECTALYTGDDCELPIPCVNFEDTQTNPCQNEGTCENSEDFDSHTCTCTETFEGDNCENEIIPCDADPCFNNGACENTIDGLSFTCDCPQTHTGNNCEIDVPCMLVFPCQNGASCSNSEELVDGILEYTCVCQPGYTDTNCDVQIPCHNLFNPCSNFVSCTDELDFSDYTCECLPTHTGKDCEILLPCSTSPCDNSGACVDSPEFDDFTCDCSGVAFAGDFCEIPLLCANDPCKNTGNCTETFDAINDENTYTCTCTIEFEGQNCELPIPCLATPCQNNGACSNTPDFTDFNCICFNGFTGTVCETPIPCFSSPCLNNGVCTDEVDLSDYNCECANTFTGNKCEIQFLPCDSNPCQNSALSCDNIDNNADYECTCSEGFTGKDCDSQGLCSTNPCLQEAECFAAPDNSAFSCACEESHTGLICEHEIPCFSDPCLNNGVCSDSEDFQEFTCTCLEQFTNSTCGIEIPCSNSPCQNSAICKNSADFSAFVCDCGSTSFTGTVCDVPMQCANAPCLNGGLCTEVESGYLCWCTSGFTGNNCETELACETEPCQNEGVCENTEDSQGYSCTCDPAFTGNDCQLNVPCASVDGTGPCQNGGNCTDNFFTFVPECACEAGYTGGVCEIEEPCHHTEPHPCFNGALCINTNNYQNFTCECAPGWQGADCTGTFPPGEDDTEHIFEDPFPCYWDDPFCIVELQSSLIFDAYSVPPPNFLDDDSLNVRKRRQAGAGGVNLDPLGTLSILQDYGCWCSKPFTGLAPMGRVLDDVDTLCREFSRCWRCIGIMECTGDLDEPYQLNFIPLNDTYSCSSTSQCAEQRCLCTAEFALIMARFMVATNSSMSAEYMNPEPELCVRGDGHVFNDQCCGEVPFWIPFNNQLSSCECEDNGVCEVIPF